MKWLDDHEWRRFGRRICVLYACCFTAPVLLEEAEGKPESHQDIGKSAKIRHDLFRSIDATTSSQNSQLW
jgi:hypothetical protein